MAQTTVELRRLLSLPGFNLFDFDYQFDDQAFKKELEQRVIDYYYDMEINCESVDMFKRKFKARWLRAIPYYNKLYNTTLLQYNPLINSKMSEALEQLATASSTSNSSGTSKTDGSTDSSSSTVLDSVTEGSDYPQQPIAGGNYLASAGKTDSTQTTTGDNTSTATTTNSDENTATSENNSSYQKTIEGLSGTSYQALIAAERENLLRIPNMLIDELKPCFMMVY